MEVIPLRTAVPLCQKGILLKESIRLKESILVEETIRLWGAITKQAIRLCKRELGQPVRIPYLEQVKQATGRRRRNIGASLRPLHGKETPFPIRRPSLGPGGAMPIGYGLTLYGLKLLSESAQLLRQRLSGCTRHDATAATVAATAAAGTPAAATAPSWGVL
jgi:hypothetical protein